MTNNVALILLSALIIISYLFDALSRSTRFPSVLMLMIMGMVLRVVVKPLNLPIYNFENLLPMIGTVGLILIVLDGALELHYEPNKKLMIRDAFFSGLYGMLFTILGISAILFFITGASAKSCLVNAIPFTVISSAIAIPSSTSLQKKDREFVIYESSFSDILGVMAMNFVIYNKVLQVRSFFQLGLDTVLILVISVAACLFLLFVLGRIKHQLKFFLILAILFFIYGIGKQWHLSSLIIILAFGLFMTNAHLIRVPWFRKIFLYKNLQRDLDQLYQINSESAFLVRTFFFTIFGFTISVDSLNELHVLQVGGFILLTIYLSRLLLLKLSLKQDLAPLFFMAPRGLISILLFLSIPAPYKIEVVNQPLMFFLVLATGIVMTIGLINNYLKKRTA